MKIQNFTDLECWKKARALVNFIYNLTRHEPFSRDFGLRDQIQRSAVSAMANIAEGFGTKSNKEFIKYLSISIRSSYETQSHLYVALDVCYINEEEFKEVESSCNDCINLCKGFIRYLNKLKNLRT